MSRVNFTDEMVSEMSILCPRELDFIDQKPEHILEVFPIFPHNQDLQMMSDIELYNFCDRYPRHLARFKFDDACFSDAGKILTLQKMLPERIARVCFCRLTKRETDYLYFLNLFTCWISWNVFFPYSESPFIGTTPGILTNSMDGGMNVRDRQELINSFNAKGCEVSVFLLSTKVHHPLT
jgi:hypothetical protein